MSPGAAPAVAGRRVRFRASRLLPPLVFLAVAALALASCQGKGHVTVYAASSLTDVMQEAAKAYTDSTGDPIDLRFGASGTLANLISEGAPADLYVTADVVWNDRLRAKNLLVDGSSRIIAMNTLVAIVPRKGMEVLPKEPRALLVLGHVAVGDPTTVPAGRYAEQALERAGAWDGLQGRLVYAPDARAVLAQVARGEADAGIVYRSDAMAEPRVDVAFTFPDQSHDPIVYVAGLLNDAPHEKKARDFLEYLSRSRARSIFAAHGFHE